MGGGCWKPSNKMIAGSSDWLLISFPAYSDLKWQNTRNSCLTQTLSSRFSASLTGRPSRTSVLNVVLDYSCYYLLMHYMSVCYFENIFSYNYICYACFFIV